mmetsp:Transcript_61011/g.144173  ORF Transcript_61011/g.144173 Transcript_61011/m.144173 type:complete len:268 (+) Transcript_61011:623-1426(+)
MVICNVAIVDLAGPPTIHGGSLDVDAQLSPHWWTYGRPYSDMFLSLHVPVVAIVPLSQSTALPPGVRAGFSFPASYTKLRHAVTQALGQYYPNSESESSRLSPSSSQWASPPPQSLPPIRGNLRAHRQPRVLYADDNGINRRIMEMMLHQVGCPVTLVGGGAEGVARATTEPFDLIITDIQMPEVDGFELTRRIREWEAGHGRPDMAQRLVIIALTGDMAMSNEEKFVSLGFDDFAGKPMSLLQLEHLLHRHFPAPEPTTANVVVRI